MPSTARVVIEQQNTSQLITESLDHVWNTQYGRHYTVDLPPAMDTYVTWPPTGEKYVYLIVTVPGATGGDLTIKPMGATTGWIVVMPPLGVRVPFLLPQQKTINTFLLNPTVAAYASMVFF